MEKKPRNLEEYYKSLTDKMAFVRKVARQCDVSRNAVINWCFGDSKTKNDKYLKILEAETKIKVKNLWNYDNQDS